MNDPPKSLFRRALRHPARILVRAAEMAAGMAIVSAPGRAVARRLHAGASAPPEVRAALLAHVYYPDLWAEIVACWRRLPPGSSLIVTAPPAQAEQVRRLAAGDPLIEIHPQPNRGRDIAPALAVLGRGVLDRFDAVLKLHTKRSPHLVMGDLRRRVLYLSLAGDTGHVARILQAFADPRTGIVGARRYWRAHRRWWLKNRPHVEALALGMGAPVRLGFFEGSMFWFRPAALAPLRKLRLSAEQFDAEAGQVDGTLHHAIERVFTLSALAAGHDVRTTGGRVLMTPDRGTGSGSSSEASLQPPTPQALDRAAD